MSLEIRKNNDGSLDEIVANNANIHLEKMDDKTWWLCIGIREKEVRLYLTSKSNIKTSMNIEEGYHVG